MGVVGVQTQIMYYILDAQPDQRQRAVSAAKYYGGRVGRRAAQDCFQMINLMFGTPDEHLGRYAALLDCNPIERNRERLPMFSIEAA
jgi:alkylation response protein AidB-like acyl-CoA dehydrogenase